MTNPLPDIKPVFYSRHTIYGFNFNPNDAGQLYDISEDRLLAVVERFRKVFIKHLQPVAKYILITEISEPVESRKNFGYPRIHFHGIVYMKNPIRYLSEHLHHLAKLGSVVVSPYNRDYWTEYIKKQKHLMAPELGRSYYLSDLDTAVTPFGATDHIVSDTVPSHAAMSRPCIGTSASEAKRIDVHNPLSRFAPKITRHGNYYDEDK